MKVNVNVLEIYTEELQHCKEYKEPNFLPAVSFLLNKECNEDEDAEPIVSLDHCFEHDI